MGIPIMMHWSTEPDLLAVMKSGVFVGGGIQA